MWLFYSNKGYLDGIYIKVSEIDKPRYKTRKGEAATNVFKACDKNMSFICVLPGWKDLLQMKVFLDMQSVE